MVRFKVNTGVLSEQRQIPKNETMADRHLGFDTLSLHAGQVPYATTGSRAMPI
jgi:hypothetical protein